MSAMDEAEHLFIVCDCGDNSHTMVFTYYPWDKEDWPFVFVSMHLNQTPFFKRIWKALKYMWGGEDMDLGHWHEVLLTKDKLNEIKKFIEKFEPDGEFA